MALACECPSDYDGEAAWYYYAPSNFNILETTKRKRCISCGKLIDIGADVLEFQRYRYPITEIEEKILGESTPVSLASQYMCFSCGGIYLSLTELGFCVDIEVPMALTIKEYQIEYAHPSWRPPK